MSSVKRLFIILLLEAVFGSLGVMLLLLTPSGLLAIGCLVVFVLSGVLRFAEDSIQRKISKVFHHLITVLTVCIVWSWLLVLRDLIWINICTSIVFVLMYFLGSRSKPVVLVVLLVVATVSGILGTSLMESGETDDVIIFPICFAVMVVYLVDVLFRLLLPSSYRKSSA